MGYSICQREGLRKEEVKNNKKVRTPTLRSLR